MKVLIYDGSFEGFLSAVFYAFEHKIIPENIVSKLKYTPNFFSQLIQIISEEQKAKRVWHGVKKLSGKKNFDMIYRVFLSDQTGAEILLFKYIQQIIQAQNDISADFGNPIVQEIQKIHKTVSREAHHVLMFVRFQLTKDQIYFATFEPKCNVLPITINHFKERFADQKWIIFDVIRSYGYYYDLSDIQEVTFEHTQNRKPKTEKEIWHVEEKVFQSLWHKYFDSVNISERKNLSLQIQHMPKRFWKYLPEKNRL